MELRNNVEHASVFFGPPPNFRSIFENIPDQESARTLRWARSKHPFRTPKCLGTWYFIYLGCRQAYVITK